jgi:hypothetical protein
MLNNRKMEKELNTTILIHYQKTGKHEERREDIVLALGIVLKQTRDGILILRSPQKFYALILIAHVL